MHSQAFEFLKRMYDVLGPRPLVLDVGSRNINGGAREVWGSCAVLYVGLDTQEGEGVDVVGDAATWEPPEWLRFDLVVCTEVLEHARYPSAVVRRAASWVKPGGAIVITCAGPGREPHSAIDGKGLRDGEHYDNVRPEQLFDWMRDLYDRRVIVQGTDVYAVGFKL